MIAFDLDGTLAHYDRFKGVDVIGEPIICMMERLKEHLEDGDECVIFTARVSGENQSSDVARHHIRKWMFRHGIPSHVGITAVKSQRFQLMYDDRAVRIIKNKGVPCCE